MRALVYTAPRELELQDVPTPRLQSGTALVRVRAVGVCGSDLEGFLGKSRKRVPPLVLGHEFSGEIAELGPGIRDFRVGDRVAVYPLIPCGRCRYCALGRQHICPRAPGVRPRLSRRSCRIRLRSAREFVPPAR